jgi:hypothetical protein
MGSAIQITSVTNQELSSILSALSMFRRMKGKRRLLAVLLALEARHERRREGRGIPAWERD